MSAPAAPVDRDADDPYAAAGGYGGYDDRPVDADDRNDPDDRYDPAASWPGEAIDPEAPDRSDAGPAAVASGDEGETDPDDEARAAVFGAPNRPGRGQRGEGQRPPVWGLSGYAWRFARSLTIPRANRLLRFGARRVLPGSTQARFLAMGLPAAEVEDTLAQVRSLDDWAEAWTGTAQRFLGEARRGGDNTPADSARARQMAALCYHVAAFFAFGDDRLARTSRSASNTLFTQSLGLAMPETRRVSVRWRSRQLPGYLTIPSWASGRRPLVVLLNGATTAKEELILWSQEFLAQGLAVLALDTPGFGEATALGPVSLDADDLTDGIFELAGSDPGLDPARVSLVGLSFGGALAMRTAAADRRVAAVVAVTPPYEPARWIGASSPVTLAQLTPLFGGYEALADFVLALDLPATVAEVQAQTLIFGAGRDLVVPPPEAARMAAAFGEHATLVWFDDAGHALFDALPEWTREAAEWLAVVMDVPDAPIHHDHQNAADDGFGPDDEPVDPGVEPGAAGDPGGRQTAPPGMPVPETARALGRSGGPRFGAVGPEPGDADLPDAQDELGMAPEVWDTDPGPSTDSRLPVPAPTLASRPAEAGDRMPEPYGAGVFDAAEASARRNEPIRGYETGLFGPLGAAAARILADEPPPDAPRPTRDDRPGARSGPVLASSRPDAEPDATDGGSSREGDGPASVDAAVDRPGESGRVDAADGPDDRPAWGTVDREDLAAGGGEDIVHRIEPSAGTARPATGTDTGTDTGGPADDEPGPADHHAPFRPSPPRAD